MKILLILVLVVVGAIVVWGIVSKVFEGSVETLGFTTLEKKNGYEIRQYDSYIIASTVVSGSYGDVTREGFTIIADYIFGNNTKKEAVAMTAPVLDSSEKIAMTAPVLDQSVKVDMTAPVLDQKGSGDSEHKIAFVMPKKYTLETLPKPNSDKVKLEVVPERKVAVIRYTWYATEARNRAKEAELLAALARDGVTITGPAEVARYNAPFSAPFLHRNEVLVPIK